MECRYISTATHIVDDDVHLMNLHGASALRDARTVAEEHMFTVLRAQIDQFLDLVDLDWGPPAPRSASLACPCPWGGECENDR